MSKLTCFKAYDIRGELGIDIDARIAYRIGRAVAQHLALKLLLLAEMHVRHLQNLQMRYQTASWMLVLMCLK